MTEQTETNPTVNAACIYAVALVQSLYIAAAQTGIVPARVLVEHLDAISLSWDEIAAQPGHTMPLALASARQRLAAFQNLFGGLVEALESVAPPSLETQVLDIVTSAVRRGVRFT